MSDLDLHRSAIESSLFFDRVNVVPPSDKDFNQETTARQPSEQSAAQPEQELWEEAIAEDSSPSETLNYFICQSLADFMALRQLNQLSRPILNFHGPKLAKLTSILESY